MIPSPMRRGSSEPEASGNPLELLRQWHVWTLAESSALETSDWKSLHRAQEAKRDLRRSMDEALADSSRAVELGFRSREWKELIRAVEKLERENFVRLGLKLEVAGEEMSRLEQTSRNLRQVQRAYRSNSNAAWQWYS